MEGEKQRYRDRDKEERQRNQHAETNRSSRGAKRLREAKRDKKS